MQNVTDSTSACEHESKAIRVKTDVLGRKLWQFQCLDCGAAASSFIKQKDVPVADMLKPVAWDTALEDRGRETFTSAYAEQYRREKERQNEEWWQRYTAYLKTEAWRRKREAVLKRDNFVCRACLSRRSVQAHHLTYQHVGDEPLFDLVAVCMECHEKITQMDRREIQTCVGSKS